MNEIEKKCCNILEQHYPKINALNYHQQLEDMLVELYAVTDNEVYLNTAKDVIYEMVFNIVPTALRDKENFQQRIKRMETDLSLTI